MLWRAIVVKAARKYVDEIDPRDSTEIGENGINLSGGQKQVKLKSLFFSGGNERGYTNFSKNIQDNNLLTSNKRGPWGSKSSL
jgi:hypothetical protein